MKRLNFYLKLNVLLVIASIFFTQLGLAQNPVFYGTTVDGGTNYTAGTIYKFDPTTDTEQTLWSFGTDSDGANPIGYLSFCSNNGLLYGMTYAGGSVDSGAIFSFNPINNSEQLVYSFKGGSDGSIPMTKLVLDPNNGLFYGMTNTGGSYSYGTIFSFNPSNNQERVLWNFGNNQDGAQSLGLGGNQNLVYNELNGLFYGTTSQGGNNVNHDPWEGTIFSFDPTTNMENVVWNFGHGLDGSEPGGLVYDPQNSLFYGVTTIGGMYASYGTIFSFNPSNDSEKVVYNFQGIDEGNPAWNLIYDKDSGVLYGTTLQFGRNYAGLIYSFDPLNGMEDTLYSFDSIQGWMPLGELSVYPGNGLFYCVTLRGGANEWGTITSFDPSTHLANTVFNFVGPSSQEAGEPEGALFLYPPLSDSINIVSNASFISIYPDPSKGIFNINNLIKDQTIIVYNYMGQKIMAKSTAGDMQQIDISNYDDGIYLIEILNADGSLAERKQLVKLK